MFLLKQVFELAICPGEHYYICTMPVIFFVYVNVFVSCFVYVYVFGSFFVYV